MFESFSGQKAEAQRSQDTCPEAAQPGNSFTFPRQLSGPCSKSPCRDRRLVGQDPWTRAGCCSWKDWHACSHRVAPSQVSGNSLEDPGALAAYEVCARRTGQGLTCQVEENKPVQKRTAGSWEGAGRAGAQAREPIPRQQPHLPSGTPRCSGLLVGERYGTA